MGNQRKQWLERLACYQYVEGLVGGRRVLEIGCSTGKGSDFLARQAALVVAMDPSIRALGEARRRYGRPNLQFVVGDPAHLQTADASFDLVMVPELQHWVACGGLLPELRRALCSGGVALLVVPSSEDGVAPGMAYQDLADYASGGFRYVRMLGEIPFWGRIMADFAPDDEIEPALDCSLVEEDEPPSRYLALCSDRPLPSLAYTVLQLPVGELGAHEDAGRLSVEVQRLRDRLGAAEQRADHWEQQARQSTSTPDERGSRGHGESGFAEQTASALVQQLEQAQGELEVFQARTAQLEADVERLQGMDVAIRSGQPLALQQWSEHLVRQVDVERARADAERLRADQARSSLLEERTQVDSQRRRADALERGLDEVRIAGEQQRQRAEGAERRCDSLIARIEQGAAELSRVHHRIAELQALRQADQWRADELAGQLQQREAEPSSPDAWAVADEPRADLEAELVAARAQIARSDDQLESLRRRARLAEEQRDDLTRMRVDEQRRLSDVEQRARRAEGLQYGAARHREEAAQWQMRQAELEGLLAEVQTERDTLQQGLAVCKRDTAQHRDRAERCRVELTSVARRLAQVEGQLRRYRGDEASVADELET